MISSLPSEHIGSYGPDVHFETRFMSMLSTLRDEHIIYYLLTGFIFFFTIIPSAHLKPDTEHTHKNITGRDTVSIS